MPHPLPNISIAALGGTIAMAASPEGGLMPALSADDLLSAVPQAATIANLHMASLASVGSASLQFTHLLNLLAWAHEQADAGCDGIVVTQGTDTLEDSAFFFHLCWTGKVPVVFTAAMRGASAVSADGPANILAALRTVTHPAMRAHRVAVVLNDTLHSPFRVQKSHTLALETFTSSPHGPLGMLVEGMPVFTLAADGPGPGTPVLPAPAWEHGKPPVPNAPDVAIVASWPGDDGRQFAVFSGLGYGGLVVAGVGAGHVSAAAAEQLAPVAQQMPVVVASRVPFGPTAINTYAYPGSEVHLQSLGAMMSGWLSPQKSRVLLWCLLASGLSGPALARAFARVAAVGEPPAAS